MMIALADNLLSILMNYLFIYGVCSASCEGEVARLSWQPIPTFMYFSR